MRNNGVKLTHDVCRSAQKIEFRDKNNLKKVVHTYTVAPQIPGRLCATGPDTLIYVDYSKNPLKVRTLNTLHVADYNEFGYNEHLGCVRFGEFWLFCIE